MDALRCVKGVDVATAFLLACEMGDRPVPERAVVRLVVRARASEHSSGETSSRGGITRAGNAHVRRALVESAWHVPMSSRDPKPLAPGQEVAPAVRRHATKCNRRLIERRGHGRRRQEAVRGQLRHGARDGVLGVGDSADGGLVARAPRTTGSDPGARRARGRWEATRVLLWAAGTATPANRLRFRHEAPSRSNEMRSREGHARILECRTCVEKTRPQTARSPGEDR